MSLVNDVLRELDKRHAPANERTGVPNEVRPLPIAPKAQRSPARLLGLVLLAGCLLLAGWFYLPSKQEAPTGSLGSPASLVSAADVPVAVSPAQTSRVPETVDTPVAVIAAKAESGGDAVVARELVSEFSGLKFDTVISLPNLKVPTTVPDRPAPVSLRPTVLAPAVPVPVGTSKPNPPVIALNNVPVSAPAVPFRAPVSTAPADTAPSVSSAPQNTSPDDWARAQSLLRGSSPKDAEPFLKKTLETQPGALPPRQALVGLLLGERRYAEAIPVLKAGLALYPEQTAWAMNLARLYVESGDYASAWEALSAGLPRAQQQADYLAFAGTVLQRLDRSAEAAVQYQAALRLRPEEARWWVGLGIALESSNRPAESKAAFQRAKALGGFSQDMGRFIDQKLQ